LNEVTIEGGLSFERVVRMSTIGPAFPAQIFVTQAEVRLVAHQSAKADPAVIKADEQAVADAKQSAANQAAGPTSVDIVT
jgi:hypothetical protein